MIGQAIEVGSRYIQAMYNVQFGLVRAYLSPEDLYEARSLSYYLGSHEYATQPDTASEIAEIHGVHIHSTLTPSFLTFGDGSVKITL